MAKSGNEATFSWGDPPVIIGIIAFVYIGCWMAWHYAHEQISWLYTYFRYVELFVFNAIGYFIDLPGLRSVHDWIQTTCDPASLVSKCRRNFAEMQWSEISKSSIKINIACFLITLAWAIRLFLRVSNTHPKLNYIKTHNIESFVKENIKLYPHLRVFSKIDLIEAPLDDPIFGMSLTSRQFAFKHRLIQWPENGDQNFTPILDDERAYEVFREQLGKLWTNSKSLSDSETILVAIAMPRVAATDTKLDDATFDAAIKDSADMVAWCWNQFKPPQATPVKKKPGKDGEKVKPAPPPKIDPNKWLHPVFDLSVPRKIIDKYINYPAVKDVIAHHAYVRTIIHELYTQARRLGVLQPAEMRWLRFYDRDLWYVLQNIGRQAGFPEAAAVMSHYLYEAKAGIAISEPQVGKAVKGLEAAMQEFKYTQADEEIYWKGAPPPVKIEPEPVRAAAKKTG